MAEATQSFATHRRFLPMYHFVGVPLLALNLIVRIIFAIRHWGARLALWEIVLAVALLCIALASRTMVLAVQDRVIRLEETLRLRRCLPDDLRGTQDPQGDLSERTARRAYLGGWSETWKGMSPATAFSPCTVITAQCRV